MKKILLLLGLLMGASSAYCQYSVCYVKFTPARTTAAYGNIGYLAVNTTNAAGATCASGPTAWTYALATGSTSACGKSVDASALYPEASLMSLADRLQQAMIAHQTVQVTVSGWNNCQIIDVGFNYN